LFVETIPVMSAAVCPAGYATINIDNSLGSVSKHPIMPNYLPDDREVGEYETTRAHG
jgi:hypothetical protein